MDEIACRERLKRFFEEEDGLVLSLSSDLALTRILETLAYQHSTRAGRAFRAFAAPEEAGKLLAAAAHRPVIVFRDLTASELAATARSARPAGPGASGSAILYERRHAGRDPAAILNPARPPDNLILVPYAAANVVEKIGFTLAPPQRLVQTLEEGLRALRAGRPEEAKEAARLALALKPGSAAGLNLLGEALVLLGRHAEAALAFETARAQNASLRRPGPDSSRE